MLKFCSPSQRRRNTMVNPGSKAAQQGVREGDLISSINGRNTSELTNGEAHTLLRNAGDQLKLGLNQNNQNNDDHHQNTGNPDLYRHKAKRNGNWNWNCQRPSRTFLRGVYANQYNPGFPAYVLCLTQSKEPLFLPKDLSAYAAREVTVMYYLKRISVAAT
ncbi:Similar to Pdlim7: PDZ and LIM domain protein 7 (Rattus norvegicus) [Cotesia congregata]|uniref:Similar to Pdlim7: PDZ and LIM domain protein 7 (Rattus norvegicus) n=1 Tax=Cotesia congregata TaxID=51543 RepID=A0A8J2HRU0_COTCN|nr:Similar to Pdlim7: PDZ and LIM domain protein 7 (Rattus norvegicus) [Cotesia congregata]